MPKSSRIDARLIYSASESDANMLWATRFFAPDPFIFIQKRGKSYLVMNDLEIDRAKSQARVDKVLSWSDYGKRWQRRGVQFPVQMTVATTDGETVYGFRYSSEGRSRSLFHSTDVSTLRAQYPDNPVLHRLSDDARLVVSEPLGDLRGAWREVPESTCLIVRHGEEELRPFAPRVLQPAG